MPKPTISPLSTITPAEALRAYNRHVQHVGDLQVTVMLDVTRNGATIRTVEHVVRLEYRGDGEYAFHCPACGKAADKLVWVVDRLCCLSGACFVQTIKTYKPSGG